eukprot:1161175-Pelagomonas_calceolata.AAC.2
MFEVPDTGDNPLSFQAEVKPEKPAIACKKAEPKTREEVERGSAFIPWIKTYMDLTIAELCACMFACMRVCTGVLNLPSPEAYCAVRLSLIQPKRGMVTCLLGSDAVHAWLRNSTALVHCIITHGGTLAEGKVPVNTSGVLQHIRKWSLTDEVTAQDLLLSRACGCCG